MLTDGMVLDMEVMAVTKRVVLTHKTRKKCNDEINDNVVYNMDLFLLRGWDLETMCKVSLIVEVRCSTILTRKVL